MSDKRFVLLCQHFYPEMISTGMHMTELASRLRELGWQITVYCAKPSWGMNGAERKNVSREVYYQGIQILRVPTLGEQQSNLLSRGLFAITFLLSVCWQLWPRRKEFSALVVTTNPPFLGLVGWWYSRLVGLPYLLIIYDVYPDIAVNLGVLSPRSPLVRAWQRATHLIFSQAAILVVIGRDMANVVKEKLPSRLHSRIALIPNWSDERLVQPISDDVNDFRREHHLDGIFVVQYAGRMGRTHNLEPLIEAARLMTDEKVIFQFIGAGAKKPKLETLAADYGLHNVQFLPYQPMERLAEMLSAADLALVCLDGSFTGLSVPSKTYGILASGVPILALIDPQSEIGQMISEIGCGLILQNPTGSEIAAIVKELMIHPARLAAMGEAGRTLFLKQYTLTRAARAYDTTLMTMLNGQL